LNIETRNKYEIQIIKIQNGDGWEIWEFYFEDLSRHIGIEDSILFRI